jgi:formylglycine-generating enzyme required for sulfatase activity
MKNCVIWCVVLLAMAGTAFSETKGPSKELAVDLGGGVKLELVLIPAGSFMMGDEKGNDNEKPVHKVTITKPFYLGKYEVTQEQWEAVMGSNPGHFKGLKNPVETVSWDDCQAFLGKLNAKTDRQGSKFVLPTDAQWEYACRAGSTTKYCFGDDGTRLGDYAWYNANSGGKTHPVGEKKPNAWGLYDIHGNVWEWCADWHDSGYYVKSPADDPTGPMKGSSRVGRGGCWDGRAGICRSAYRYYPEPGFRYYDLGLRVARVPADK